MEKNLEKNLAVILSKEELEEKLAEKRPLVIKMGFDPTSPDLHLGHAIALKKLKEFQDLGHRIIIIIGDVTAKIGDPTGKDKTRKPLTEEEIEKNAKTYINQLGKILDITKIEARRNSEWLEKLNIHDFIKLFSLYTVQQMLGRNDFSERLGSGSPIAMHEIFYPLIQGYDSVVLEADVEIGGQDQLFNFHVARYLQEKFGQSPQVIMCTPILRGTDGVNKMSKSLNNYIALFDPPEEMYGKTMSIPDDLIEEYLELASSFSEEEKNKLRKENPLDAKKKIAFNLVEQYHSKESAIEAEKDFENKFQKKKLEDIKYIDIDLKNYDSDESLLNLTHTLAGKSKSVCRKLFEGGAISLNGEKVFDINLKIGKINKGTILKIGKLNYYKFK